MRDLPAILIITKADNDALVKRLWACLPPLPDKFLIACHDIATVQAHLPETLMIFVDLDHVDRDLIEVTRRQIMLVPCPVDIIGLGSEMNQFPNDIVFCCDAVIPLTLMDQRPGLDWLRYKIQRAQGRLNLMATCTQLQDNSKSLAVSRDAYVVFGPDQTLQFASDSYRKTYNRGEDRLVAGMPGSRVFQMLVDEIGVHQDMPIYKLMKDFWTQRSGQIEVVVDNDMVLRLQAMVLVNGQDVMVSVTDITLYCQQQGNLATKTMELEAALAKEREASSLQQQFISMVSHEFRTPLSIIDGNAQLLERHILKGDMESMGKRIRTIRSAVSRVVQMMEGILSSNLLRSGTLNIHRTPFNLATMLEQMIAEQREMTPSNVIDFVTENLPETVNLDQKLVGLIATNLLGNAVKYGGKNPHVLVQVIGYEDTISLIVADNGVGIPEEEKYRIFDRFYRASTSTGVSGTGIGLSLVRELVDLHGGKIDVQSIVGQGSKFTVSLPL
jgi:signal transduction histidine kinase